jgi:hypothetical protein
MNPTGQPMGMPAPSAPSGSAQDALNVPSILLMILAGLMILNALWGLISGGGRITPEQMGQIPAQYRDMVGQIQGVGRPLSVLMLVLNGIVLYGALQMRQLKSFGLAMAAAIIAMIPCATSCCCILGLPVGIWALVTLNKPEVKSAFR